MHFTITNSRPLGLEFVMALISWIYQSWPQHLPTFVAPEFQALRAIVHKRIHWVHGHPVMRLPFDGAWMCLVTYRPTNSWPSHPFCWTEITQTNKQLIPWSCADAIAVIVFFDFLSAKTVNHNLHTVTWTKTKAALQRPPQHATLLDPIKYKLFLLRFPSSIFQ